MTTAEKTGGGVVPEYRCEFCGETIRTNAYFVHVRKCERKPKGATKKLYPPEIPEGLHRRFKAWCAENDLTLSEGVWKLIKEKLG